MYQWTADSCNAVKEADHMLVVGKPSAWQKPFVAKPKKMNMAPECTNNYATTSARWSNGKTSGPGPMQKNIRLQCCSSDGSTFRPAYPNPDEGSLPLPIREPAFTIGKASGTLDALAYKVPYFEAKSLCEEAGGRLCTKSEVIAADGDEATTQTDPKADFQMVWTSSTCVPKLTVPLKTKNNKFMKKDGGVLLNTKLKLKNYLAQQLNVPKASIIVVAPKTGRRRDWVEPDDEGGNDEGDEDSEIKTAEDWVLLRAIGWNSNASPFVLVVFVLGILTGRFRFRKLARFASGLFSLGGWAPPPPRNTMACKRATTAGMC
jgi:hypothetical protein